jgi:sorting nexin-1/2
MDQKVPTAQPSGPEGESATIPSRPAKAKFTCEVTDPESRGEGMYKFISYKVNTRSESSPGAVTVTVVERRFSDFVWLQERLLKQYRGVLIPPLPDKQVIAAVTGNRFSGDFINERRRGLEKFLNRIGVHQELQDSPDVELFLNAEDASFAAARQERKGASSERGLMNFFRETAQSLSNQFGAGAERQKTADDVSCEAVSEYARMLEGQLEKVHGSSEELVSRTRGLEKSWFEFAIACTLLGGYESKNEEEALGQICSRLGNTADRLSILFKQKGEDENIRFREPLKDYLRYAQSVQQMCNSRSATLLTFQTSMSVLEDRQRSLAEVQGVPGKEARARAIEVSVAEAQTIADQNRAELQRVTQMTLAEAARFRIEKEQEIRDIIINFVNMQIQHSRMAQAIWQSVLPNLENTEPDDSNL